jgi:uncharacterized iron-regulated membrane protein
MLLVGLVAILVIVFLTGGIALWLASDFEDFDTIARREAKDRSRRSDLSSEGCHPEKDNRTDQGEGR